MRPLNADQQKLHNAWHDPHAIGTVLLVMLLDEYGADAMQWTPDTIAMELHDDLNVQLAGDNLSKLMTTIQLCTSDEFYKLLPTFNEFCSILAGEAHLPGVFIPADAAACAWGITEAFLLNPPDDDEPFTDEIRAYIGHICKEEGIIRPPDVLRIAIHDPNLIGQLQTDFADDPEMFSAIDHAEQEKTNEITNFLKSRIRQLSFDLERLPLKSGNTREITRKIVAALDKE